MLVLFVKGNLPLKKHGAEVDDLGYFRHFKSFRKHFGVNLEDFADLTNLFSTCF
jgi:hypothetical protein